jgi:serine protease Do
MRSFALVVGTLAIASTAAAQQPAPAPMPSPTPRASYQYNMSRSEDGENRAALGINTQSTGKRDTLGLLVTSVTAGGPAEVAGITEGDRLQSINGTSLKLAAADAGEPDMNGLMTRRLVREMGKVKPGDDVTLGVFANGGVKNVKVKTVAMDSLMRRRSSSEDRAALGIGFGGGSVRDTLGLFVESVTPGGPAEKAGIEEGNRIAAINGTDLRVAAVDATDGAMVWAKQERLTRVLEGVKPGDVVELKIYANGGWKTVKVTTVKMSTLFGANSGWSRYAEGFAGMKMKMAGMAGMAPMAPMPPMGPMPPMRIRMDGPDGEDYPGAATKCVTTGDGNMQCTSTRSANMSRGAGHGSGHGMHNMSMMSASSDGDGELNFPGLRLSGVTPDLASYFGAGSEKGLLVLEASSEWSPLQAGDVVLSHNGRVVQRDGGSHISIDSEQANTFVVLRKGKKLTLSVKAK